MATVILKNIQKQFGATTVLNDINLQIEDGEFVVLVGPSGCGKSTLLRILAGLEQASSGEISLDGAIINNLTPKDRNFSLIFQNYALFPHMTVEKNITFGMKIRGEDRSLFAEKVDKVAELLQLMPLLKRKPKELSGGQRQRMAMARAIVREPKLFLMDEPLSNLDAKLRVEVRDGIIRLYQQLNTTTVYVTHDQIEAMTMADRIVVMNKGEVQQVGTPEELYSYPKNLFVAKFIGTPSMNIFKVPINNGVIEIEKDIFFAPTNLKLPLDLRELYMGIRPEHISHVSSVDNDNLTAFKLLGIVKHRELHGAEYLLTVQTTLGNMTYRLPNNQYTPKMNAQINLHIPSQQLHFFSTTTENNLFHGDLV